MLVSNWDLKCGKRGDIVSVCDLKYLRVCLVGEKL